MKLEPLIALHITFTSLYQRGVCSPTLDVSQTVPGSNTVQLSLALAPLQSNNLRDALNEISDPRHPRYGRYLSQEEAAALSKPHDHSITMVRRWLQDAGVDNNAIVQKNQFIDIAVPKKQAELLFDRQVHKRDRQSVQSRIIPHALRASVLSIHERQTQEFGVALTDDNIRNHKQKASEDVDLEQCKSDLTPACVRAIYRMNDPSNTPAAKTRFTVVGFDQQTAQRAQLEKFLAEYAPYAAGTSFSDEFANGGSNHQGEYPSGEGNLDIQLAVSLAYKTNITFLSVGGVYTDFIPDLDLPSTQYGGTEPFLELARYLIELPDEQLPQVVVISYGTNEQLLPFDYANLVCNLFGQLGTRGVSVIVASGDFGPGASCQSNRGDQLPRFLPSFPATCPYVTAVGATANNSPEIAASFSGGGFSDYFERQTWQRGVVKNYLNLHGEQFKDYYNASGRAIPDVATLGSRYVIYNHDNKEHADGTSASAPVFASMIAILNSFRATSNKPPLGFLNPWLYSIHHTAFTDITEGKSEGCLGKSVVGTPAPIVPGASWAAVPGWDPATGLGTPLFDRLKQFVCRRIPYTEGQGVRVGVKGAGLRH